jgi:quercetin dioxygenase-like cupin family protein
MQMLKRTGTQFSGRGPVDYFTGTVRIDPLNAPPAPARYSCAAVTFEPGARSNWHTHPLGQTLIVTFGCGWTQCEGEERVEFRAGDVIGGPPGHRHRHGATATTAMTRIAIQAALDGTNVDWMEPVTDAQYLGLVAHAQQQRKRQAGQGARHHEQRAGPLAQATVDCAHCRGNDAGRWPMASVDR